MSYFFSLASGQKVGNLTLENGIITDSDSAISFDTNDLLTTGTLGCGAITSSGKLIVGAATTTDDSAAIGYTTTEGIIITGQGSTNDVTIKNDADVAVLKIPTGTTNVQIVGTLTAGNLTLATGSITDPSNAITFSNTNLSTTGTLGCGAITSGAITATITSDDAYSDNEFLVASSGLIKSLTATNFATAISAVRVDSINAFSNENSFSGKFSFTPTSITVGTGGDIDAITGTGDAISIARPVVGITISGTDTEDIFLGSIAAGSSGQMLIITFDNTGLTDLQLKISFGSDGLVSGSGYSQYLTFSQIGQSAQLIFLESKWRIINTGAAIS